MCHFKNNKTHQRTKKNNKTPTKMYSKFGAKFAKKIFFQKNIKIFSKMQMGMIDIHHSNYTAQHLKSNC